MLNNCLIWGQGYHVDRLGKIYPRHMISNSRVRPARRFIEGLCCRLSGGHDIGTDSTLCGL
jgi:hypothetical protein